MTLDEWLATPITWSKFNLRRVGNVGIISRAVGPKGEELTLAMGSFPDEDLYALYVDGALVGSFNNYPPAWPTLSV